jgi:hypothetical protein
MKITTYDVTGLLLGYPPTEKMNNACSQRVQRLSAQCVIVISRSIINFSLVYGDIYLYVYCSVALVDLGRFFNL